MKKTKEIGNWNFAVRLGKSGLKFTGPKSVAGKLSKVLSSPPLSDKHKIGPKVVVHTNVVPSGKFTILSVSGQINRKMTLKALRALKVKAEYA